MTECKNCGSQLTNQFARVYGNEYGEVFRCIHCVDPDEGGRSILRHGGAAIKDMKEVQKRMFSRTLEE